MGAWRSIDGPFVIVSESAAEGASPTRWRIEVGGIVIGRRYYLFDAKFDCGMFYESLDTVAAM